MFQLFKNPNYNFMGWKWFWITLSLVLNAAALIVIPIHGIKQAVEFTGGVEVVLRYINAPHLDEVRSKLEHSELPSVSVTTFGETGGREIDVRAGLPARKANEQATERDLARRVTSILTPDDVKQKVESGLLDLNTADSATISARLQRDAGIAAADADKAAEALSKYRQEHGGVFSTVDEAKAVPGVGNAATWIAQKAFTGPFGLRSQQLIEGSVSGEMRSKALYATLGALLGMGVYIWFRFHFQWGLGAVFALIHDTIFTLGLFSIFGYEANLPVVAAFLTLIGYSMNDTVVIFDRIRENMKTRGSANMDKLINDSINETLSRTVVTSLLTWVSVLALFLWGGPVLKPFAFVLLVGIIVGTYSSIFIASPILTIWMKLFQKREKVVEKKTPVAKGAKGVRA